MNFLKSTYLIHYVRLKFHLILQKMHILKTREDVYIFFHGVLFFIVFIEN